MSSNSSNYKSIFKATAVLGSVQFFNIIIGVVRNKIVSILLGPSGMGIIGLLQSSSQTVSGFTNCGISTSSVKNIATAYSEGNMTLLGKVIYIVRRLVFCTGSLAALVLLFFSKQFSQWSFGNENYSFSFACLSISLLFSQLTNAYTTIIQGCRRINYYAKANVIGHFLSLVISVPMYYFWGKVAIVPVLIIVSVSTFVLAYIYEKKLSIPEVKASKSEFKAISVDILKMGIPLAVAEVFPLLASYLIRLHVSSGGGVSDVGLFSAGFAMLNGYVGMIFTAMSADYIPRLSAIVNNNKECEVTINRQINISILILLPIIVFIIAMSRIVVWILYSEAFFPMIGMICWGALGMLFKTFNWCYGCILIPKRDSKPYFFFSILSAAFYLGTSVILYNLFNVTGLGIAFLASHSFDFLVAYIFISQKYSIHLEWTILMRLVLFTAVILLMIYLNNFIKSGFARYIVEGVIVVLATGYCLWCLNRLVGISSFIKSKFTNY